MRTTFDTKTIAFRQGENWSPEMSFEQFEKVSPCLSEISEVIVKQIMTKEEVEKMFPKLK